MTKRTSLLFVVLLATTVARLSAELPGRSTLERLAKRAEVIKPTAKELPWLKIPWVLDLKAAQKTAKAEGRPIFLWVTGDDPLGRC